MLAKTDQRYLSESFDSFVKAPTLQGQCGTSVKPANGVSSVAEAALLRASQKFSLAQIRAFVAAAQCGSFSRAAVQLGISQSSLSRCIKDLESAVGRGLFQRSRQGVGLSPTGQAMLLKAQILVREHACVQAFVESQRDGHSGVLRLAADASVAPVIWDQLSSQLQRHAPDVGLEIAAMGSEEAVNQVLDHRADFALCGAMEGIPQLRYTPLLNAPMGLIIPPGCKVPDAPSSLEALDGVPFVRLADYTPVTRTLRRHDVHFPAYFNSGIVYSCLSAAFDFMRSMDVAAVASGIGASLPQTSGMRFQALPDLLPSLTVYLVSPRQHDYEHRDEYLRDLVRLSVHESPWHPSVQRVNPIATGALDSDDKLLPGAEIV